MVSTASPRDVIVKALFDWAGSGQGVDDMLAEIAQAQSDAILSALAAAGYRVVREGGLDAAIEALRHFDQLYYPVSTEINPKGYAWHVTDDALEFVKEEHDAALRALVGEAK